MSVMEYENALNSLVGLPLAKIGRAADLLWMQFGTLRQVKTRYGEKAIGDWAIHVQTSWRFVCNAQILLAVGDLYLLPNGDSYDWEVGGESNFDVLAAKFNDAKTSVDTVVQHVQCDDVGSFSINFCDGTRFDVFPKISDSIEGIENWRMFQPSQNDAHTVCQTGKRGPAGD